MQSYDLLTYQHTNKMNIFKILLAIHVFGGGSSLLLGLVVMLVEKGGKLHKTLGGIYFFAMSSAAIVAIPMSYIHPNYFLFIVSIFTLYMLVSGKRYIAKKKVDINKFDWLLSFVMLIFAIAFIGFGAYKLYFSNSFGTVLVVFGFIGLLFVYQDYVTFRGKYSIKNYWLTTHLQRMIGSYVASLTAFLVVNNTFLPSIIAWLLPTLLIVPLIIYWTRKYKILITDK